MDADSLVVGAGVVGLAVARELAISGRDCIVLEQGSTIGQETSSRNSEVIHAGIHYAANSLKARACVEGKALLYRYLHDRHIPHKKLTKLIVATSQDQILRLTGIQDQAAANGVDDLEMLDRTRARLLEPALNCSAALLSPSTGIVDSHAYLLSLLGEAEDHGAMLALSARFQSAESLAGSGFRVRAISGDGNTELRVREIVNCAGLGAQSAARGIDSLNHEFIPERLVVKGNYFTLRGRCPFTRLIYPVPEKLGLGVHLTLDINGVARFGPDTETIEQDNWSYDVDPDRCQAFYPAIRLYWPALKDGALVPAYAGVRPKLEGAVKDFRVDGPELHGVAGLVNCFGLESPGLTASLYLGRTVLAKLQAL